VETELNFIDIHCHILPGIDDGPAGLDEAVEMLGIAKEDGISSIFATPHILDGLFANKGAEIVASVEKLKQHVPPGLELLWGADVRVVPDLIKRIESGEIPTLSGSGYMLMELPEYIVPPHLDSLIVNLRRKGVTPIITHPERHLRLMHDHKELGGLKEAGAMCQITAMSITGDFGKEIKRASLSMIEKELADIVATDAHNADRRPPILSKAYKEVKKQFGEKTAELFFFQNPKRILKNVSREP
jgi:protein-tyrosine phosphatase